MRWKFWQRPKREPQTITLTRELGDDPFANSPFNKDVITKDDPEWAIFEKAMETGGPVVGYYDGDTGEIVSIEPVDSYQARHDAIDEIQNLSLSPKPEES